MKHLVRLLGIVSLAALIVWLIPALVQGSQAEESGSETPPARILMLQSAAIPQSEAALTTEPVRTARQVSVPVLQETEAAVRCESRDGNGWLITGPTWPSTVYLACPPEGMPG